VDEELLRTGCEVYLYRKGLQLGGGRTNGRRVAKGGGYVIGAVERGKRVYKSCCGGIIPHPPAYEDGTDREFRNVGYQLYMDTGDLPKK